MTNPIRKYIFQSDGIPELHQADITKMIFTDAFDRWFSTTKSKPTT